MTVRTCLVVSLLLRHCFATFGQQQSPKALIRTHMSLPPDQQQPPRKRRRWKFVLLMLLILPVLAFTGYTWFTLTWSYSSGERAGYVQKLSKKGFIVKTWEGELAMVSIPGTLPEIFHFTVRNDTVAAQINASLGKRVRLHYNQHIGVPLSIFGETEYFVDGVTVVE